MRRRLTITGHVDDDYLRSMAELLDAHPEIAAASQITSAEIRDHLHFTTSYRDVADELVLNGRKMADTLLAARAGIGERALLALKISRTFTSPARHTSLIPHLEAIDREFAWGRRRRASTMPVLPAAETPRPRAIRGKRMACPSSVKRCVSTPRPPASRPVRRPWRKVL